MNILLGMLIGAILGVLIARINWYKLLQTLYRKLPLGVVNSILYFGSIAVFVALFLSLVYVSCSNTAKANVPEKVMSHNEYDNKIIAAYSALLHEVWLDKPSYVEDALSECDAFVELDELLDGEWGDVFVLKNKQDSIRYQYNWDGGESRCIHEF